MTVFLNLEDENNFNEFINQFNSMIKKEKPEALNLVKFIEKFNESTEGEKDGQLENK